jgi:hypothetical protein
MDRDARTSSCPDLFDEFFISVLPWHLETAIARGAGRDELIRMIDQAIESRDRKERGNGYEQ